LVSQHTSEITCGVGKENFDFRAVLRNEKVGSLPSREIWITHEAMGGHGIIVDPDASEGIIDAVAFKRVFNIG
jgi:hypothetical protein